MKEALKLALEALQDYVDEYGPWREDSGAQYALRVGKEALAQQSNEQVEPAPVAKVVSTNEHQAIIQWFDKPMPSESRLFTHPPVPDAKLTAQREPTKKEHDVLMGALKRSSKVVDNGQTKEPEQEPMFWYRPCSNGMYEGPIHNAQIEQVRKESGAWKPLYTTPPQRKPLTDKQLNIIGSRWHLNLLGADEKAELFAFAKAIEAAHGIKE